MRTSLTIILLTLLSVASHADSWCDAGNYSISWYKTTSKEFTINNEKELAGVAYLVNNGYTTFLGVTINLGRDINLLGKNWIPIGTDKNEFKGKFNGHGYAIKNVNLIDKDFNGMGFFYSLTESEISNLIITGNIDCIASSGLLCVKAKKSSFSNIEAESTINYKRTNVSVSTKFSVDVEFGGLIANSENCNYTSINMKKCNINFEVGDRSGDNCYAGCTLKIGGIIGMGNGETIENCTSKNYIDVGYSGYFNTKGYGGGASIYYGGIVGSDYGRLTINSCLARTESFVGNHYIGVYDRSGFYIGGIAGKVSDWQSTVNNCVGITNGFSITGRTYYPQYAAHYAASSFFGGICYTKPATISGNYSNNDVIKNLSRIDFDMEGEHGSRVFSSKQMKTQNFIDEINMFCQIKYGEDRWRIENGELSLNNSGLEKVLVSSISLNKNSDKLKVGENLQITATVSPSNAIDKSVTWKSSDVSIATVSQSGYVTAKKEGKAIITCTANDGSGKFATCEITVKANEIKVSAIELNPSRKTIQAGNGFQITATITPSNATDKSVTWKSSNENIATVSKSGYVTAKKEGEAIITCTANDGSGKFATCDVTVESDVVETVLYEGLNEDDATCDWTFESFDVDDDYNFIPSDKEVWRWAAYNGKHYLVGNAHEFSAPFYINSFAFSPAIRVNKLRKFRISFDHAAKYQKSGLFDLYNVRLYDANMNWELTAACIPILPTPGTWTFVNSGEIEMNVDESKTDVSSVRICLYYHGDSEDGADAWEIRNLKMVGIGPASAIEEVIVDAPEANYPTEVYNLSGIKVAESTDNLPAGIYIVRRGPSAKKIAIQ